MLSEGRPGVDDRFFLKDGKFAIESGHSWRCAWNACELSPFQVYFVSSSPKTNMNDVASLANLSGTLDESISKLDLVSTTIRDQGLAITHLSHQRWN